MNEYNISVLNLNEIINFAFDTIEKMEKSHKDGCSYRIYPDFFQFRGGRIELDQKKIIINAEPEGDLLSLGNCLFYLLTGRSLVFADLLDPAGINKDTNIPIRFKRLLKRIIAGRTSISSIKDDIQVLKYDLNFQERFIGFRLNENRNHYHQVKKMKAPVALKPVWSFQTKGKINSSPIISRGLLYCAASDRRLYFIDKTTGEELASPELVSSVESTPAISENNLYIGDDEGNFYIIDIINGQIKVTKNLDNSLIRSSPLVIDDTVFIGTYNGNLFALCRDDLEIKWRVRNKGWIYSSVSYLKEKNAVIAVWDKGKIGIFSHKEGKCLWQYDLDDTIRATPVYHKGKVYIASFKGIIYIIDTESFEMERKIDIKDKIFSTPVIKDNLMVLCTMQRDIIGLDLVNKSKYIKWRISVRNPIVSSPVIFEKYCLIIDEGGSLYIIDIKPGKILIEDQLENFCRATPFFEEKRIFTATSDMIKAYNLEG